MTNPHIEQLAVHAALQRKYEALLIDRDALHTALDNRYDADQKAARAIFAETGRTSGFPGVREVVAYYVAEVERLEKERDALCNRVGYGSVT